MRRLWLTEPPSPDERNEYASGLASLVGNVDNDPDRLWVWLSFAYFFQFGRSSGEQPVRLRHRDLRCRVRLGNTWPSTPSRAGNMRSAEGLPLPEDFFASYEAGDLLVPWPCPSRAAGCLACVGARVFGRRSHGRRILPTSALAAPVSSTVWGSALWRLGNDAQPRNECRSRSGARQEAQGRPRPVRRVHRRFFRTIFNIDWLTPTSEWGLPARQTERFPSRTGAPPTQDGCQKQHRSTNQKRTTRCTRKAALIQEFDDDAAEARRLSSEAGTLLVAATGIRSAISSAIFGRARTPRCSHRRRPGHISHRSRDSSAGTRTRACRRDGRSGERSGRLLGSRDRTSRQTAREPEQRAAVAVRVRARNVR